MPEVGHVQASSLLHSDDGLATPVSWQPSVVCGKCATASTLSIDGTMNVGTPGRLSQVVLPVSTSAGLCVCHKPNVGHDGLLRSYVYERSLPQEAVHNTCKVPVTYDVPTASFNSSERLMCAHVQAIVFSQFWMHVNLVARCLEDAAISAAIFTGQMDPAHRVKALASFQDDPSVGEKSHTAPCRCSQESRMTA